MLLWTFLATPVDRHYFLTMVSRRTIPVMILRHQSVFHKWSDISSKAIPISSHFQGMQVMREIWEGCPRTQNSPILVYEVQSQGLKKIKTHYPMEAFNYAFARIKKVQSCHTTRYIVTAGTPKSSTDSLTRYYLPINTKFFHGCLVVSAQYTWKVHENRCAAQGHQQTRFNWLSFTYLILGVVLSTTTHSLLNFSATWLREMLESINFCKTTVSNITSD